MKRINVYAIALLFLLVWNLALSIKVYHNYVYARKRSNHSTSQILTLTDRLDQIPVIVQEPRPIVIADNGKSPDS